MSATSYNNDGINDSINDSDINDSEINDSDNKIDIANDSINFVCKSKRECINIGSSVVRQKERNNITSELLTEH